MPITSHELREARGRARVALSSARSGDKVDNKVVDASSGVDGAVRSTPHATSQRFVIAAGITVKPSAWRVRQEKRPPTARALPRSSSTILGDFGGSIPRRIVIPEGDGAKS
jgi:hypothetical protein